MAKATPQTCRARTGGRFAAMRGGAAPMTQAPDQARRRPAAAPLTALPPARHRRVAFAATPNQPRPDGGCAHGRTARRAVTGVRRERLLPSAAGAKGEERAGGVGEDGRTPFVLRRKAGAPDLDEAGASAVGNLGARMRALGLGQDRPGADVSGGLGGEGEGDLDRGPVLLVLDGHLQSLPWESVPQLRGQR